MSITVDLKNLALENFSNEDLKALINDKQTGIIIQDNKLNVIFINQAASEIFDANFLTSKKAGVLELNEQFEVIQGEMPFHTVAKLGVPIYNKVIGIKQSNSHTIWIQSNTIPEKKSGEKKPSRIFTIFSKVSSRINEITKLKLDADLMTLLNKVSGVLMNIEAKDLSKQIDYTLAEFGKFMSSDRSYLFTYNDSDQTISNTNEWCNYKISPQKDNLQKVPYSLFMDWKVLLDAGKSIIIDNITTYTRSQTIKETLEAQDIKSLLVVPLMSNKKCLGFIGLDWVNDFHYSSENEKTILGLLSTMLAGVIERVNTSEEVRSNQERLKSLIESQSNYMIRTDMTGRHTFWNDKFKEDFGWLYNKLGSEIGESMNSICDYHHERTRQVVESCIINPGKIFKVELDKPSKEGGVMTTLWEFICLTNEKGEPSELQCIGIDITEQKTTLKSLTESEEKYRSLFNNSPDPYLILDDGKFVECNKAALELHGAEYPSELLGKTPMDISPKFQEDGVLSEDLAKLHIQDAYKFGHATCEWKHIRKNGSIYISHIEIAPITYQGRKVLFTTWKDITKEKLTQKALIESEYRFKEVARHSGTMIWECDVNGLYTYVSPVVTEMLGYLPEEIENKVHFFDLFPEQYREEYLAKASEVIGSGEPFKDFINPVSHRNGKIVWMATNGSPVHDENGSLIGYRGADSDITEKRIIEAEKTKFKIIADQASYGVALADLDGVLMYVNKSWADMHGYSTDEMVNQPLAMNHDESQLAEVYAAIQILQEKGEFINIEIGHKRKDGSLFPTLMSCKMISDENNIPQFMSATVVDISQIKAAEKALIESEQNLNYAQEIANMGSWEYDYRTDKTYWSKGYYKLIEREFDNKLVSYDDFNKLIHPDDKSLFEMHQKLMLKTKLPTTMHFRILMPDGRIKWIQNNIVPHFEGDELVTLKGVNIDITDRVQKDLEINELNRTLEQRIVERTKELELTNADLIKAREEADKANQSKSDFLSRMSHELRTPMNSILGFAQLLEMSNSNEKEKKNINHIIHSGKHLLKLINEVLDIARIESGRMNVSLESVSLYQTLNETYDSIKPIADQSKISIHCDFESNKNVFLKADAQRLKQVLTNLLSNSIKYNNQGGNVWINTEETHREKDTYIRINVKDDGIGIKKEFLSKLFQPFERLNADRLEIEGTGLGLSMVKQLSEMMNGFTGVESEEGVGSTFWIDLPAGIDMKESAIHSGELQPVTEQSDIQGTIVYIEDNNSNIELVDEIISTQRNGIKLVVGKFGSMAVNLAINHKPRLIFLDLNLPDISGEEVLKQLKSDKRTSSIPVIIVSADALQSQINKLLKNGADHYLTKPFDIKNFLTFLDSYFK